MKDLDISYFVGLEVELKLKDDSTIYQGVLYYTGKEDIYVINMKVFTLDELEYVHNLKS